MFAPFAKIKSPLIMSLRRNSSFFLGSPPPPRGHIDVTYVPPFLSVDRSPVYKVLVHESYRMKSPSAEAISLQLQSVACREFASLSPH